MINPLWLTLTSWINYDIITIRMTSNTQAKKNLELASDLASYIVDNPDATSMFPPAVSFIMFSKKDKKLNEVNEKLIISHSNQGYTMVKAQQTDDPKKRWIFSAA